MRRLNASQWILLGLLVLQVRWYFAGRAPFAYERPVSIVQFAVITVVVLAIGMPFGRKSDPCDENRLSALERSLAHGLKRLWLVAFACMAGLVAISAARTGAMPLNDRWFSVIGCIALAAMWGYLFVREGSIPPEQAPLNARAFGWSLAGFACAFLGAVYAFRVVRSLLTNPWHGFLVYRLIDALVPGAIVSVLFATAVWLRARAQRLEARPRSSGS
ncbi:MAG: hypothetical protein E6J70_06855 [Deltaproteobacteria bacterium]|nr:MAG: hypothetical protein E6J70_06855 [Deltaproteobacteria bacterium]